MLTSQSLKSVAQRSFSVNSDRWCFI